MLKLLAESIEILHCVLSEDLRVSKHTQNYSYLVSYRPPSRIYNKNYGKSVLIQKYAYSVVEGDGVKTLSPLEPLSRRKVRAPRIGQPWQLLRWCSRG